MQFITDRTEADVLMGTAKGVYQDADLNRVEEAVAEISAQFHALGIGLKLVVKTDWKPPEDYSPGDWVTEKQMARYLENVAAIRGLFPVAIRLPQSMADLTWEDANNIEKILKAAAERIAAMKQSYRYSGEFYAGEEN